MPASARAEEAQRGCTPRSKREPSREGTSQRPKANTLQQAVMRLPGSLNGRGRGAPEDEEALEIRAQNAPRRLPALGGGDCGRGKTDSRQVR